jgi:hypothetical protein
MTELSILKIQLEKSSDEDDERLGKVTSQLRQDLLDLDIEKVEPDRTGKIPEGARGDPFTLGTLILTLAASGGVFSKLIDTLQLWLNNRGSRHLTLEMDGDKLVLDGNPTKSQQQLIDLFINRHTRQDSRGLVR